MLPRRVTGILVLLLCGAWPACAATQIAGSLKVVQGTVTIRRGTDTIPGREGLHLLVDDVLQTAADGRLGLILQDGTRVSMGPNTELKIDSFIFEPVDGRFGLLLRMFKGVLAYVSGKIGQLSPGSARIETPVAVIGLRGTHFAITLEGS